MRKILFSLILLLATTGLAHAQKYALIDMDYILRNVPAY